MAKDLNRVTLIGRLTKDPETKQVGESQVTSFSLAVNGYKDGVTYFFNCNAWGKTSEIIAKYVKKGVKICVDGELQQRVWDDQTTGKKRQAVDVQVLSFYFTEKRDDSQPTESSQPAPDTSDGLGTEVNDAPAIDDGFDPFDDGVPM